MRLFFDNLTKLKKYRVFLHVRSSRENTKSAIQKKCRTSATKCTFFCLPVLLMALGGQTFKNTWFFNDPAGLSEKMCAPLRRNARKNENQFLNGRVGKVSGAKHQKNKWFFNIFHEKYRNSLPKPWRADTYTCPY